MTEIVNEAPPGAPRRKKSSASVLLPPLIFLGAAFIAEDWTVILLAPLKQLQIQYPVWMEYSHFLIPGACAVIWLASFRKWPNAGAIIWVLLCFMLLPLVPRYIESRVAKVPVIRWLESNELKSIEDAAGVPIFEQGSQKGTCVIVAPANEQRVRNELVRLKLLSDRADR